MDCEAQFMGVKKIGRIRSWVRIRKGMPRRKRKVAK
jgi:hypothetical protein